MILPTYIDRSEIDMDEIFIGWHCQQKLVNIERAKVKMSIVYDRGIKRVVREEPLKTTLFIVTNFSLLV